MYCSYTEEDAMDRDRKNNRIPNGLSFLMWPALLRAPWLLGSFTGLDDDLRRRDEHRRRKQHR
jgi:hypothetical protein